MLWFSVNSFKRYYYIYFHSRSCYEELSRNRLRRIELIVMSNVKQIKNPCFLSRQLPTTVICRFEEEVKEQGGSKGNVPWSRSKKGFCLVAILDPGILGWDCECSLALGRSFSVISVSCVCGMIERHANQAWLSEYNQIPSLIYDRISNENWKREPFRGDLDLSWQRFMATLSVRVE